MDAMCSWKRDAPGAHLWQPAWGGRPFSPVFTEEPALQPHIRDSPGLPWIVSRPGVVGISQQTFNFVSEQSLGRKQPGVGEAAAELQVTCRSHGALLHAAYVARQKLMAEVRKHHVQKHLKHRDFELNPLRPEGPACVDTARLLLTEMTDRKAPYVGKKS